MWCEGWAAAAWALCWLGLGFAEGWGLGWGPPFGAAVMYPVSKIYEGREHETMGMPLQRRAAAHYKELDNFQLSHLRSSFCPPKHVEP